MTKLFLLLLGACSWAYSQEQTHIAIHFLYGSKPAKQFKGTEKKWFGGKMGGHVGIELAEDKVLSFAPQGKFHWIGHRSKKHSHFIIQTKEEFWNIFGRIDAAKQASVTLPISSAQKHKLDSISSVYLANPPYDYALVGFRCGAAAYEILGQVRVVEPLSKWFTVCKIAYPKRLRKLIFKMAKKNTWAIYRQEGTQRRIWERD